MCLHPDSDGFFWPTFSPDLHWPKPAGNTQRLFSLFPPAITDVEQHYSYFLLISDVACLLFRNWPSSTSSGSSTLYKGIRWILNGESLLHCLFFNCHIFVSHQMKCDQRKQKKLQCHQSVQLPTQSFIHAMFHSGMSESFVKREFCRLHSFG